MRPASDAFTNAISDSADVGITFGYFSLILLIFSSEVGRSALFAIIIIGFAICNMFLVSSIKSSSSHLL